MNTEPRDESDAHTIMLKFECDYCGALAGQWCIAKSGGRAGYLHSARYYKWREVAHHGK